MHICIFVFMFSLSFTFSLFPLLFFNYKTFYARCLLRSTALSTSPLHGRGMGGLGGGNWGGGAVGACCKPNTFSLIIVITLYSILFLFKFMPRLFCYTNKKTNPRKKKNIKQKWNHAKFSACFAAIYVQFFCWLRFANIAQRFVSFIALKWS